METFFLIGVSFLTSTCTAIIGMGGGIMLISAMPGLLPAAAIVPVHGAVQLASNSSRVLLGLRHIENERREHRMCSENERREYPQADRQHS